MPLERKHLYIKLLSLQVDNLLLVGQNQNALYYL